MKKKVLVIDDDPDMCILLSRFLTKHDYDTDTANSGVKGIEKFKEINPEIVVCDYRLGDKKDGKDVLKEIRNINPKAIVLIITGYSDIKTAVDVIKLGAYDYITKPLIPDEVLSILNSALSETNSEAVEKKENDHQQSQRKYRLASNNEFLVGEAGATKELYRQIELVAPTNFSVILYGESGTGKEVIARTIHNMSSRKDKPFVAMDCGTLSKELAGSELFGHVKGSFTGALSDKEGHFELAQGGTLFLDEVANLSSSIQASLLRVIQERKFKRVGGTKEMETDVRIIVASNENLQDAYQKGKFREDLYHRFNEFSINLPALRHRSDDILLFASFFLDKTNRELNKDLDGFDDDVMKMFVQYSWPGNLRELRNVVRRAVLLTDKGLISKSTLPWEIINSRETGNSVNQSNGTDSSKGLPGLKHTASRAEYEAIMNVLKEVNYNKTKAAELLKIDRKTLYNKIKSFEDPGN